jgi:hypothetical protein
MTLHASNRSLTALSSHFLLLAAVLAIATQVLAQGPPPGNQPPPPPPTAGINATLDPDGSSATYIVTEQLVGINFPNDAEGTTPLAVREIIEFIISRARPGHNSPVHVP